MIAAFCHWLKVPRDMMFVTWYHPEWFLVHLKEDGLHDKVLSLPAGLKIGGDSIRIMPWTELWHTTACMLKYKLRIYIKGVPLYAHKLETVAPLFAKETLVERLDYRTKNAAEAACCCV